MEYLFEKAGMESMESVYALIDQRIEWMDEIGIRQWNVTGYWEVYPKNYYIRRMEEGSLYVLKKKENSKVVSAAVLLQEDARWEADPDKNLPAYYVHHFAADLKEKGVGKIMLEQIEQQARRDGKIFVRLDCDVSNRKLNDYYEQKGYVYKGECVDGCYFGKRREKKVFGEIE
jgi:GNAT superfamily N-acetyltransferase